MSMCMCMCTQNKNNQMKSVEKHSLNNSSAKASLAFLKSPRSPMLAEGSGSHRYYDIPSTINKRACSFGYGNKSELARKNFGPPPGAYEVSDFIQLSKRSKHSFGLGRDEVVGGPLPKKPRQSSPGPGEYATQSMRKGNFYIGTKLGSSLVQDHTRRNPGPGTYDLKETSIMKSGRYMISSYRNPGSPSLKSRVYYENKKDVPGPGNYELKSGAINKDGKYIESHHHTNHVYRFSRGVRPSMAAKQEVPGPGSYSLFSQFGNY